MNAWMIGPFLLTINQLSVALACISTYFLLKTTYKTKTELKDEVTSSLLSGIIILLITYKALPLLTNFEAVVNNPAILLYSNSGQRGFVVAFFIMAIYLFIKALRSTFLAIDWIRIALVYFLTFFLIFWLVRTLYFLFF